MNFNVFLNFNGNCREAVAYYAAIFGLDIPKMMTYGEASKQEGHEIKEQDKNRVIYTNLKIGRNDIRFSDCLSNYEYIMGNNICLSIGSEDSSEVKTIFNELKEGGKVHMPLGKTFWSELYGMLADKFGVIWQISLINYVNKVPSSAKAGHKWDKEISQIEFTAKSNEAQGRAIWRKRNELVLLSGAKLKENPQLNKDGSLNFSAKFAQKLRLDHINEIKGYITTKDIVFASPNEWGIFLFYGGQNTWLELKDSNGKTLDEWSRVK